jgi:hypothetical protein
MTQSPAEDPAQGPGSGASTSDFQSRWHWVSNRRSAENNEISVLAIIETIVAGILTYLFYRWTNTLWHVGLAACLSPFLLLRTSRSTELSLRIAERLSGVIVAWVTGSYPSGEGSSLLMAGISFPFIPLLIGVIKFISTFLNVILHPIATIEAIPRNWQRIVFCTDIGALPELIPTIEQASDDSTLEVFKTSFWFESMRFAPRELLSGAFIEGVIIILFTFLVLLPGLAYRYAVKSTALIWSPLLWAVRPVSSPTDVRVTMDRITTRAIYKASRIYSTVVVLAFAGKMYLWFRLGELQSAFVSPSVLEVVRGFVSPRVLEVGHSFIVPDQLPLWHVTSAFNALASWCLYLLSDYYYKDWQRGLPIPENALRYTFWWVPLIMNIFTIYSLFCTVYITVQETSNLNLPPLHAKLFPW